MKERSGKEVKIRKKRLEIKLSRKEEEVTILGSERRGRRREWRNGNWK